MGENSFSWHHVSTSDLKLRETLHLQTLLNFFGVAFALKTSNSSSSDVKRKRHLYFVFVHLRETLITSNKEMSHYAGSGQSFPFSGQ